MKSDTIVHNKSTIASTSDVKVEDKAEILMTTSSEAEERTKAGMSYTEAIEFEVVPAENEENDLENQKENAVIELSNTLSIEEQLKALEAKSGLKNISKLKQSGKMNDIIGIKDGGEVTHKISADQLMLR